MTVKAAIEVLLNEQKCINRNDGVDCDRQCEDCDPVMDLEVIRDAYKMAISALEKQIPMKIRIEREHPIYGYASFCPNCNRMDVGGWPYCPDCGQAITME